MIDKFRDWYEAHPVRAFCAISCLITLLLVFSVAHSVELNFNPPVSGPGVDSNYTEVATYVVKVGSSHTLCWANPNVNADGTEYKNLQLAWRRYRIEGGPMETSDVLQYAQWKPSSVPKEYCNVVDAPKKAGHWAYQARMCHVPYVSDERSCSIWVAGLAPSTQLGGAGQVDGRPKGWWIYAYLPAPTGVGT